MANVERLLRLAEFLENEVPPTRFDLLNWASGRIEDCGTTGCAVGWATTIPEFREAGLHLEKMEHSYEDRAILVPSFTKFSGWTAIYAFFDLLSEETHYLFDAKRYRWGQRHNPLLVAKRIRHLLSASR